MNAFRKLSVGKKLLLISMVSSSAALLLAGIALSIYDLLTARKYMHQELSVLASVIGDRSTAALVFQDESLAAQNLAAARARSSIESACIYTAEGRLFAAFEGDGAGAGRTAAGQAAGRPCPEEPPGDGSRFGERALVLVQPILLEGERVGTIYLRSHLGELDVRLAHYGGIVVLVVLLAAAVAFVSSTGLRKIISDPIRHLAATARNISEHRDYSVRARRTSDDELGVLVDAFNGMLDVIEERNRAAVDAKEQLEAAVAELEAKAAELERFTYTVSHDLKAPLITIRGFLGLLDQDVRKGDEQRMAQDMERINAAAHKMGQLLNELLELSRIGRVKNPSEVVPMDELVGEAVELAAGRISERGALVEVAPGLPAVYGDRERLLEVVQNLVENAVKFMGDQEEPRVEIGSRGAGGETVYYVRDNGIGIDPRYRDKVFGLFERLDTGIEGTGIGLAIVKRIVEVHGGRIWVESEGLGRGASFCFTVPSGNGEQYIINNPEILGDPEPDPEVINTVELGLAYRVSDAGRFAINFFRYELEDVIQLAGFAPSQYRNVGERTGEGFEVEGGWQGGGFELTGNYAFQESTDETTGTDGGHAPGQQLYLRADWRLPRGWRLGGVLNAVADRDRGFSDPRAPIDDYLTVDLVLRREQLGGPASDRLDLGLIVRNLFDEDAREPSSFIPGFPPRFLADDLPLAGRAAYVELRYRF